METGKVGGAGETNRVLFDNTSERGRNPEGILRWNAASRKSGSRTWFRCGFSLDDPEFDPDNLKYSCVRYIPSTTANAMGLRWIRVREIINASVLIYNDVIR
ncbi:MAG: hypothetical protein ACLU4N_20900 [Butyricimonas faecihominis]